MAEISGDAIADTVLKAFDDLPQKRKPLIRSEGVKEWVPLSGIVVQGRNSLVCLSAATGMKCLPQSKISQANGLILHDWHAEVLAIRAFNRFLLEECHQLASEKKESSEYVRFRSKEERTSDHFQPFALNDGISLHMYCSEAPCGDASMELTMAAQEDATPWELPSPLTDESPSSSTTREISSPKLLILHGRSYFSHLGLVRRKPSRPDAPPTLSKSCTDKLSLSQSTSLLSSLTSLLISPKNLYIHTLVLPSTQYSSIAVKRAFLPEGRLGPLFHQPEEGGEQRNGRWGGGYKFKPFRVVTTEKEFAYSRRQPLAAGEKIVPSNLATAHTPRFTETLIGGTLQGKKAFSVKGASRVCKRRVWRLGLEISRAVGALAVERTLGGGVDGIEKALGLGSYGDVKRCDLLSERRKVKEDTRGVLGGWVRNVGGEEFGVEDVDI